MLYFSGLSPLSTVRVSFQHFPHEGCWPKVDSGSASDLVQSFQQILSSNLAHPFPHLSRHSYCAGCASIIARIHYRQGRKITADSTSTFEESVDSDCASR